MKPISKKIFEAVVLCVGLMNVHMANAALESRLGGQALYDTDLNITWTANANINGLMTWDAANMWASNLVIDGVGGWRLPTTMQPDPSCSYQSSTSFGAQSSGTGCTGSEMGHLFYDELGGVALASIATTHNSNYTLFGNLQPYYYWSGTEYAPDTSNVWVFLFLSGAQGNLAKGDFMGDYSLYAMAVHPGDVAAVPVPSSILLLGSGLFGLAGIVRKLKPS